MKFELGPDVEKTGLQIISSRQKVIDDLSYEKDYVIEDMKEKCPELAAKLLAIESNLKVQKKYLKESLEGLKNKPFTMFADVIVQPSSTAGYIEFIENNGTETVLLEIPGTSDDIIVTE